MINRFGIKNKELISFRSSDIFNDIEKELLNCDYILSNSDYKKLVNYGINKCKKRRKEITEAIFSIFIKIENVRIRNV